MKGALQYPFYDLKYACLPGIELLSPGAASAQLYNPLMPVKLWRDRRPNLPAIVQYQIVQVISGGAGDSKAILQTFSMGRAWAQSINVPLASAAEGPPGEPELPFPVRDLYDDEELAINPALPSGIPVIRNKTLYAALVNAPPPTYSDTTTAEILMVVEQILARLERAGIG